MAFLESTHENNLFFTLFSDEFHDSGWKKYILQLKIFFITFMPLIMVIQFKHTLARNPFHDNLQTIGKFTKPWNQTANLHRRKSKSRTNQEPLPESNLTLDGSNNSVSSGVFTQWWLYFPSFSMWISSKQLFSLHAHCKFHSGFLVIWHFLRIPAMYEVKNSKICNFWMFWPVIQLINHLFQNFHNNRIIDQNIQKCCICLMHSRYP